MSYLAVIEKKEEFIFNPEQKKFDRLQKQLIDLEQRYKEEIEILDSHLNFYQTQIQPLHLQICDLWKNQIKIIYKYAINKKIFNNQDKRIIFNLLSHLFHEINTKSNTLKLDDDLSLIFEKVEGISYKKLMAEGFEEIQEMVDELFANQGIKIDLSDFDYSGTEEEILQKLFAKIGEQNTFAENKSSKSKKEEELEFKKLQLEDLQKKGLSSIYKQLAKSFHPDLEIDPTQKTEKESLMKKLTLAYEEKDLNTLLSLERQWSIKSGISQKTLPPDQLKHYNLILSEQVLSLKKSIASLLMEPKYYPLQSYHKGSIDKMGAHLAKELKSLKKKIPYNRNITEKLHSSAAIHTIKSMIYR